MSSAGKWAAVALLALGCGAPTAVLAAGNKGYVRTDGTHFSLGGRPHYFAGVNFWQGMNLGMADVEGGDRSRLARELHRLSALGITNVRLMASSEGPNSEPYRVTPALQTSPGVYDPAVLDGLDYVVFELDRRRMRAVMVLNNFWHWSGGMAQYVSWAESSTIPYPPSYPDFTGSWGAFTDYAARFYTNAQAQEWFRNHIWMLVNHMNPYTGRTYRNEPTIFAWELANEPRRYPASWIDDTAGFIKSIDPNHMVTAGSEGSVGGDFISTHDGANVDYATVHVWPQNWGWYEPASPATYAAAEASAKVYLQDHLDEAANLLGKPLVLEEFGLARDWEPLHDIHDPNSPTTIRDRFFRAILDEVYGSASTGGAAGGSNFWAWAGEAQPPGALTGDPPHETPGWYSVYDRDFSTHDVLSTHAARMQLLVPAPPTCGNGTLDADEECDDGNTDDGDCCDGLCRFEAAGSPCPDDGNPCTADVCDEAGGCTRRAEPEQGCRKPTRSRKAALLLKDRTPDSRDRLVWKWLAGEATDQQDFGDPLTTTDYTLCVYEDAGGLVLGARAPAGDLCSGRNCWKATAAGSFRYKNGDPGHGGFLSVLLSPGDDGRAKIAVRGGGQRLAMPRLPLARPVVVQLVSSAGVCWEARYTTATREGSGVFKAKGD